MKFISTLKAERSIAQLLAERDMQAPEARKAMESLRKLGTAAIPKLIDAFATAEKTTWRFGADSRPGQRKT
jgi:hypothetical protein